jgi:HEPN domain-containing protein
LTRTEFQQLAEDRVLDAQALLAAGRWSAAYYLAGYAVECGLKSCVLVYLAGDPAVVFRIKRFSERCWTHDLEELIELAGLEQNLKTASAADPALRTNWVIVAGWSEQGRYQQKTQVEAEQLFEAVADPTSGVLTWIRGRW